MELLGAVMGRLPKRNALKGDSLVAATLGNEEVACDIGGNGRLAAPAKGGRPLVTSAAVGKLDRATLSRAARKNGSAPLGGIADFSYSRWYKAAQTVP